MYMYVYTQYTLYTHVRYTHIHIHTILCMYMYIYSTWTHIHIYTHTYTHTTYQSQTLQFGVGYINIRLETLFVHIIHLQTAVAQPYPQFTEPRFQGVEGRDVEEGLDCLSLCLVEAGVDSVLQRLDSELADLRYVF